MKTISLLSLLLIALVCVSSCIAAASSYNGRVTALHRDSLIHSHDTIHEDGSTMLFKHRKSVPRGWKLDQHASVDPSTLMHLHIALHLQNTETLESLFWDISNPQHESYAKYLTLDDLKQILHPGAENLNKVEQWLKQLNQSATVEASYLGDAMTVTLPLHLVETLLNTRYHYYEHITTGERILRCSSYSIPKSLEPIIAFIGPTLHMIDIRTLRLQDGKVARINQALANYDDRQMRIDLTKQQMKDNARKNKQDRPSCTPYIDIPCLEYIYSINGAYGTNSDNSICATGYDQEYINGTDIEDWLEWFDPQFVNTSVNVIGPNDQSNPGGEATQDVQLLLGIAANVPNYFWSTGGSEPHGPSAAEPFLAFWTDLCNSQAVPLVVSTSYGDNELDLDMDYLNAVNAKFQIAATRGVSILFASGDGGVAGGQSENCTTFIAVFPSASPYVTAVGGTEVGAASLNETAADFSSGGFSNYWAQPSYQTAAVKAYLTQTSVPLPPSGLYNVTGRAFPDVAAVSDNVPTVLHGSAWPAGGTSCASPIFAGVIALLNDYRLNQNKNPLGFLNNFLYQQFATRGVNQFTNDITAGNNPGCNTNGFYATTGFDPVTGMGSPIYEYMLQAVQNLP